MMQTNQTFSITLPTSLYQQVLQNIGRGKISSFVRNLIDKELNQRQALRTAYQALENCPEYQREAEE